MSSLRVDYSIVPKDTLVLVTGVTGFLGSHVALQTLEAGFRVRGTVRSSKKGAWIKQLLQEKYGQDRYEEAIVEDMSAEEAFDNAVKASVMTFSPDPHDVIPQSIAGAVNCLHSAAKESSVKRFVFTSSSMAAVWPVPDKELVITKDTYNEDGVKQAWKPPPYEVSSPSRELYRSTEINRKPADESLPLMGRILSPEHQGRPSTSANPIAAFEGKMDLPLSVPPQWYIDAEDAALLHVAALTRPDAVGERVFGFAKPFNWNDVLGIYRKLYPNKKFPEDTEGLGRDIMKIPNERAEQMLKDMGMGGWTSLED
ncbi:MAG: hypothetical protein M1820_010412, partial [Bogoriella megaspora]